MRPLDLPTRKPAGISIEQWIGDAFETINQASREDSGKMTADSITIANPPDPIVTSFDADTATLDECREVIASILMMLASFGNASGNTP